MGDSKVPKQSRHVSASCVTTETTASVQKVSSSLENRSSTWRKEIDGYL